MIIGEDNAFTEEIRVKMEELFTVNIPSDRIRFVEGIEIEIKIPSAIRNLRDSFALFLYKDVYPKPDEDVWAYTGKRLTFELIPPRAQIYYRIPLDMGLDITPSPDTVYIEKPLRSSDFPLILTILPVMKGIPATASIAEFRIRTRTVLKETGSLEIDFTLSDLSPDPDMSSVNLYLDGKSITPSEKPIVLTTGLHSLEFLSDDYRSQSFRVAIEPGKTTVLSIPVEPLIPRIYFEGPNVAEFFFDGEKLDIIPGVALDVTEGEHTLLFKIGDYRVSKRIFIEKSKDYNISLFLDILVEER